jgi:hypothetical protein
MWRQILIACRLAEVALGGNMLAAVYRRIIVAFSQRFTRRAVSGHWMNSFSIWLVDDKTPL